MSQVNISKIKALIQNRPGSKALEIANHLGCSRKEVNSLLYQHINSFSKDSDHRWFIAGQNKGSSNTLLHTTSGKEAAEKKIRIASEKFPGRSLFSIDYKEDQITVSLNETHVFFNKYYLNQNPSDKQGIDALLGSLAKVFERHYDEADFIEQLINEWGSRLQKYIEEQSASKQ